VLRDPMMLMFSLFLPVVELFMLGYAIDTNVRNVRTVIYDQCNTQESRALIRRFETSQTLRVTGRVFTDAELTQALVSARAHVAIKIPRDYSQQLEAGRSAQVLLLVDGSESSVASEAVNVGNALALNESLERLQGGKSLAVECRPRVMFNPDTRSANFFIPGLMCILCQMMATMLAATAIVREKEQGTLEQLFMTPVRPIELLVGKMLPYGVLTLLEFCVVALLMRTAFQVPIHGAFLLLLGLAVPFVLTMLGIGLLISTRASTREAASQMTIGTVLPSVFLSGYIFPIDSMPRVFQMLSGFVPATWMIDASRGVILRGSTWHELWLNGVCLWAMALAFLLLGTLRFRRQIA
jgi:ABC-2 type transport system permease protein